MITRLRKYTAFSHQLFVPDMLFCYHARLFEVIYIVIAFSVWYGTCSKVWTLRPPSLPSMCGTGSEISAM